MGAAEKELKTAHARMALLEKQVQTLQTELANLLATSGDSSSQLKDITAGKQACDDDNKKLIAAIGQITKTTNVELKGLDSIKNFGLQLKTAVGESIYKFAV